MSSVHVYVRLHKGQTIDDISEGLLEDCAQLVKVMPLDCPDCITVSQLYCPHCEGGEERINEIVNRLNRTKVERKPDLKAEREAERAERKLQLRDKSSVSSCCLIRYPGISISFCELSPCFHISSSLVMHLITTSSNSPKLTWLGDEFNSLYQAIQHPPSRVALSFMWIVWPSLTRDDAILVLRAGLTNLKRREEMERLDKERQAEVRSYKNLMVAEKMTSNNEIASANKSLQELEEDIM
ncbi:hypothetical protein TEA_001977 [Camellia sinensis var. sinensis]|uniref:Uncharacterized protein n=1 Tax=Camellia sinensis var. sinensis TaxID=542762 RepID=A0A4S4DU67_CAMSN|nr:hypothetical protein TEA_001977 [Camellia sinensis var. sinensis]